jgi:hypothetical protein
MTVPLPRPPVTPEESQAILSDCLLDLRRLIAEIIEDRQKLHGLDLRMQFALGAGRLMKTTADLASAIERQNGAKSRPQRAAEPVVLPAENGA